MWEFATNGRTFQLQYTLVIRRNSYRTAVWFGLGFFFSAFLCRSKQDPLRRQNECPTDRDQSVNPPLIVSDRLVLEKSFRWRSCLNDIEQLLLVPPYFLIVLLEIFTSPGRIYSPLVFIGLFVWAPACWQHWLRAVCRGCWLVGRLSVCLVG